MAKSSNAAKYNAEDIEILEGLEPVRKRPGMYIAGTDTPAGLHQLVFEILDNSVDEAMNGYADKIDVILHEDGESVTISDNGRGIPVDLHPKLKRSALEIILTTLHAGGKFGDKNYKTSGGLHGVGSSVVNALSSEMIATITRDGGVFEQSFSRGHPITKLKTLKSSGVKGTGTRIFFRPDKEIFSKVKFNPKIIRSSIQTKAYLNPGLRIIFKDETSGLVDDFCYQDGLKSYLVEVMQEKKLTPLADEIFILEKDDEIEMSVAFCWTDQTKEEWITFANGISTPDGGTHELGAKSGIAKAIRNYMNVHNINLKGLKIGAEDMREGIVGVVSVKLPSGKYQAQFQGQTKSKLNNPEVSSFVENLIRTFEKTLNEKPSIANLIIQRITLAAKARAASRAAVDNVRRKIGISHRLTLPGKLADCSSSKSSETELFIVEGDSAGGSTKQGRDRNTQAVLPLRGKVLNTVSATEKKILDNKELASIVSALGCGVGDSCDPAKLRYGKIIILTDADADGSHIATLLLAFFYQYMRPLIEAGHIFIGKSPLYGIYPKSESQKAVSAEKKAKGAKSKNSKSSSVFWAYSEDELNSIVKKQKLTNPRIIRFKGLGEMNPDTLWDTTLNPEKRTLLRMTADDFSILDEAFKSLMGSDSSYRYQLIKNNAEFIEVDI